MKKYFSALFFLILICSNAYAVEELTLIPETVINPSFTNRYTFLVGVNPSVPKMADVTNFTFSYGKKLEDFWIDSSILFTKGLFGKMTANNSTATTLTDDQLVDTKSTLTTIGLGIGRESHYIQSILAIDGLYEMMATDITYNIFKESTSGLSFTGIGMIAKFALCKKFSDYYSLGTQFTYNLAVVKRSANYDTENSSARSLMMSNLTIGFDLSFYL